MKSLVISRIVYSSRVSGRVLIYLEEQQSPIKLSVDDLLEQKLKPGTQLDSQELSDLQRISANYLIRSKFLSWVSLRQRSNREAENYLQKNKVEQPLKDQLIAKGEALGFVSDRAFAEGRIRSRLSSGRSRRSIEAELRQKGVSSELISELLSQSMDDDSGGDSEIISINMLLSKTSVAKKSEQKQIEYLLRKGFNYSDIKQALQQRQSDL